MYPYMYYLVPINQYNMMRSPIPPSPPFMPPPNMSSNAAPTTPPPKTTPSKKDNNLKAVDPGSIRFCKYKFTYIWPNRGKPFWAWIVYVGRRSISGYRWTGYRYVYFGMGLKQINSFVCY